MNYKYTFYIGANNSTGIVDIQAIKDYFQYKVNGFTMYESTGLWLTNFEPSAVVEIIGTLEDRYQMVSHRKELERILEQKSILLTCQIIELLQ